MSSSHFQITARDGSARTGQLTTVHGEVSTPLFFSVATRAAIRAGVSTQDLRELGAPFLLANTYHLELRPGSDLIDRLGGLHTFLDWDGPILTDSGGFQVFSIRNKTITDEGVAFRSHIDGDLLFLNPRRSIQIQHRLGADIVMAFDQCTPNTTDYAFVRAAVDRTFAWESQSIDTHFSLVDRDTPPQNRKQIYGILQGGLFEDLRQRSLEQITSLPFDGFALGGMAVLEPGQSDIVLSQVGGYLPREKPRYMMGIGTPRDILTGISYGMDIFDCVLPMRNARHGKIYTWEGQRRLTQKRYREDTLPVEPGCSCPCCASGRYSRAYIRHLLLVGEDLGRRLLTLHNLHFYYELMRRAREAIQTQTFASFAKEAIEITERNAE